MVSTTRQLVAYKAEDGMVCNVWRGDVIQNYLVYKILFDPEPADRPVHDRTYWHEKACIVMQFSQRFTKN